MKNWDLLAKYVSNECSPQEQQTIEEWIKDDPDNAAFLNRVKKTWQQSERKVATFQPDVAQARQNIWDRIDANAPVQEAAPVIPLHQLSPESLQKDTAPLYRNLKRLAAAIVAGLAFIIVALLLEKPFDAGPKMVYKKTEAGEKSSFSLPDGTKVWLNENSSLQYPEYFADNARVVSMEGEAFFDVKENQEKPFSIQTGGLVTKVLGTSFNIDARNEQSIAINVVSGRVLFYEREQEDEGVVLIKGEKATYHKEKQEIQKNKVRNDNFLAWQTGVLTFDNARLEEVVKVLSDYYGKDIQLSPALLDCHYTATFERQSLDEILEILQISLGIQTTTQEESLLLEGDGC